MYYFLNHANDEAFRTRFRVPRVVFSDLKQHLSSLLQVSSDSFRADEVHPPEAIAQGLHFFGSEGGLRETADAFLRGDETIRKHTLRFAEQVISVYGLHGPLQN